MTFTNQSVIFFALPNFSFWTTEPLVVVDIQDSKTRTPEKVPILTIGSNQP